MANPNRRIFLMGLTGAAAAVVASPVLRAQNAAAPAPALEAKKLSNDLYLIAGDGGNITVVKGDGLMLVDSGLPERAADLMKSVADIDSHKVAVLFNTHWHYDHTGGNETLGRAGAKIFAHENVKKRLSVNTTVEALGRTFPAVPEVAQPRQTFAGAGSLAFGNEKLSYQRVNPAHTDGDAYVFFNKANVLHTGDLLFNGFYPFIDYSTGGWIGGMVAAEEALLKVGDAKTRVIPGHGLMATKAELKAAHDMLATVYQRLQPMAKKGMTVDEVVAAAPTREFDEKWGGGFMKPEMFVKIAYTGLLKRGKAV